MASPIQARTEFASALNQVCAERGIDPEVVLETIKTALIAAFRKDYPQQLTKYEEDEVELIVDINSKTGASLIYAIIDGKKQDITPPGFGRIAAQTAKQVILQRVREAEKAAIIDEYQDRIDTMVTGMVLRFDGKNVIFDIGRGQGYMPPEEQIRGEYYKMNQRMAVYIKAIRETMRGKTIIVSRSTSKLVEELFRREVPEVNSGAVEIKAIAREAGLRTKIAVLSTQSGVDPVGSCVGQKGVRVQEVINELNNEKIDIIQFSENPQEFIAAALAPAENLNIEINDKKKKAAVSVPDDQLSLAIGRGGQNVRLAAKLTGYKLDIKGSQGQAISVTGDEEFEIDQLELSSRIRNALVEANITRVEDLEKHRDTLTDIEGIGPKATKDILKALENFNHNTQTNQDSADKEPPLEQPVSSQEEPKESTDSDAQIDAKAQSDKTAKN